MNSNLDSKGVCQCCGEYAEGQRDARTTRPGRLKVVELFDLPLEEHGAIHKCACGRRHVFARIRSKKKRRIVQVAVSSPDSVRARATANSHRAVNARSSSVH